MPVRGTRRESNTFLSAEERHRVEHQLKRRAHLARVRNWLAVSALRDEEWALWLDADLFSYPQCARSLYVWSRLATRVTDQPLGYIVLYMCSR